MMKIRGVAALISGLLICSACESKPARKDDEKLTRDRKASVELEVDMLETPRPQELEAAIMLSPGIRDCLRLALRQKADLAVEFSGKLSANGGVYEATADHADGQVNDCLRSNLNKVQLGEGPWGPFKMRVARIMDGKPKSKTIQLNMKETKKYQ